MKNHQKRTAACILAAVLMSAMLLGGCGSSAAGANAKTFGKASGFGTLKYESDSGKQPLGEPVKKVDAKSVYAQIDYTPEFFCKSYSMAGSFRTFDQDNEYIKKMKENCGTMKITASDNPEEQVNVADLPYRMQCAQSLEINDEKVSTPGVYFAQLGFFEIREKDDSSFVVNVGNPIEIANYQISVEGNQMTLRRVGHAEVIPETGRAAYTLTDEKLHYDFKFQGCDLILTSESGCSVILNGSTAFLSDDFGLNASGYIREVEETFAPNIEYLSLGSKDGKNLSVLTGKDSFSFMDGMEKGRGSAILSDDGLLTITPQQPEGEQAQTYQFVYFLHQSGLILTDGTDTYYYDVTWAEHSAGDAVANFNEEDLKKTEEENSEKIFDAEKMQAIKIKQADLRTDLAAALKNAGLDVEMDPVSGEIVMGSGVLFGGDSAELTADAKTMLATFAQTYAKVVFDPKYDGFVSKIYVEGHTAPLADSTYESGLPLSQERAQNVADYCVSDDAGVDKAYRADFAKMLIPVGCSCGNPILKENGEPDLDASRRVAFRFEINLSDN